MGALRGGLKVFGVRYRRKYYVTNRLSLSATEVRTLYRKRQEVEEVIRVLKSQLSLESCQAGYRRSSEASPRPGEGAQEHHIALCLVAYLIVERERLDHEDTWRQRKRQLILRGPQGGLPTLERVRGAAQVLAGCASTPSTSGWPSAQRSARWARMRVSSQRCGRRKPSRRRSTTSIGSDRS